MATLKETTIEGNFRAEDQVLDLTYQLSGAANDPDQAIPGLSGFRVNRGSEPNVGLFWDEDQDVFLIGDENNLSRVLVEGDIDVSALTLVEGDNIALSFNASTGDTTVSSVPSGVDGAVQFNSVGAFGADGGLTYDIGTQRLTATGGTDIGAGAEYRIDGSNALYINGEDSIAIGQHARDLIALAEGNGQDFNLVIGNQHDDGVVSLDGFSNIIIGSNAANDVNTSFNTYIGYAAGGGGHTQDASLAQGASDQNVYIGSFAGWGAGVSRTSTYIGTQAGIQFNQNNSIGLPWNNVAVGNSAMARAKTSQSFALGTSAMADFTGGQTNIFIGNFSGVSEPNYPQPSVSSCIVLGDGARATASNQLVFGTAADKAPTASRIHDVHIGQGVEALNPETLTIHSTKAKVMTPTDSLGTGGMNASKQGGDIVMQPGPSAGDADGSAFIVRTSFSQGVGEYEEQPTEERLNVSEQGIVLRNTDVFLEGVGGAAGLDEVIMRDQATGRLDATPVSAFSADANIDAGPGIDKTVNSSTGVLTLSVSLYDGETLTVEQQAGQTAPLLRLEDDSQSGIFEIGVEGDAKVLTPGQGIILISEDGTRFRQTVGNDGTITITEIAS